MQLGGNRLEELRQEIERARKELELGREILRGKEKKEARRDKTLGQEEIRLREQRRSIAKDIALEKSETSSNKAAPPPAPKNKAPPINLLDSPNKSVQISQDASFSNSGGAGGMKTSNHYQ